jgi:hypothetical protein
MPKLMTGNIRKGSKCLMRRWPKFSCGGTISTASGTMKSRPAMVPLFLNSALAGPTGQPALAEAVPLRAGSYHLIVVMKNIMSGETYRSELDFTVD